MVARVKLNSRGIVQILKSSETEAALTAVAEPIAAAARSGAPVESGAYQGSITVAAEQHSDRVVVHVTADVPYAMRVEAKTGNLARALGG